MVDQIDKKRRDFLVKSTAALGGIGVAGAAIPFAASLLPSAKAEAAGAPVDVDITDIDPGCMKVIEWRGKPVWILCRTDDELKELSKHEKDLRDPGSKVEQQPVYAKNRYRSIKPKHLVLVGVCTHLGCSPTFKPEPGTLRPDWPGGFYCPCHGSVFDLAGRVFKGVPAPINLEVPPYRYISEGVIRVGEDEEAV